MRAQQGQKHLADVFQSLSLTHRFIVFFFMLAKRNVGCLLQEQIIILVQLLKNG